MAEIKIEGSSEDANVKAEPSPELVKLQTQIENLNKAIASTRGEAAAATKEAMDFKVKYEALQKSLEEAKKSDTDDLDEKELKKLEAFAKKTGLVTKEELDQQKVEAFQQSVKSAEDQAINEFLEANPEFNEDANWNKVKDEFKLYKQPTSLQGYRQLLAKIKKDLGGASSKEEGGNEVRAQLVKRDRLSLGGGSQKQAASEVTVEDLQKRYPNLSQAEIKARLDDINALYSDKKK